MTGELVPLFNPREMPWGHHFRWDGVLIIPLSGTGRATCDALAMNRSLVLAIRRLELMVGRHPPD